MADEVLKVVGSADMSSLTRGLTEAQRGLSQTASEALKTERSLGRLAGSGVKDVAGGLSNLGSAVNRTTESLKGSVKGSAQASNALLNLGRVAQDAPFGFIGIANNLNPLLESFQRLQQSSGSTGSALKVLASSLIGGGGLGLALSLVTAGLSFVTNGFGAWTRGLSTNKEQVDEVKKSTKDLGDSIKGIVEDLAKEKTQVSILVAQIKEENLSREQRNKAIQKLKQISPEYFGILNTENATINQITNAYNKYSASILKAIEAKVREKQLSDVTYKILELQRKGNDAYTESVGKNGKIVKIQNAIYEQSSESINDNRTQLQKLEEQLNRNIRLGTNSTGLFKSEQEELENLIKTRDKILKELTPISSKNELISLPEPKAKKEKDKKETLKPFKKISFKYTEDDIEYDFGSVPFEEALAAKLARESINKGTLVLPIPVQPKLEFLTGLPTTLNEIDELKKIAYLKSVGVATGIQDGLKVGVNGLRFPNLTALYESTIATTQLYTDKIKEFSTNAFASLGEAIGNSLSAAFSDGKIGNVFGNLFGSILKSLGEGLKQLGIQAIAASKLIIAIRATLGKPAGILGGIAMIALGTLISSIASKIQAPKFATGTRNFTGGTALVGERGPELLTIPSGASVTPNAQSNAILNGAANGGFVASYVLRGQDLVTVISRTTQSNNRLGF